MILNRASRPGCGDSGCCGSQARAGSSGCCPRLQHLPARPAAVRSPALGSSPGPAPLRRQRRQLTVGQPGPCPSPIPGHRRVPTAPGDKMAAVVPVTGRGAAPPSGRQEALPLAQRPALPRPSHKAPRRRPAGLFPAPIMAVSGGAPPAPARLCRLYPPPSAFGGARLRHGPCGRERGRLGGRLWGRYG